MAVLEAVRLSGTPSSTARTVKSSDLVEFFGIFTEGTDTTASLWSPETSVTIKSLLTLAGTVTNPVVEVFEPVSDRLVVARVMVSAGGAGLLVGEAASAAVATLESRA